LSRDIYESQGSQGGFRLSEQLRGLMTNRAPLYRRALVSELITTGYETEVCCAHKILVILAHIYDLFV